MADELKPALRAVNPSESQPLVTWGTLSAEAVLLKLKKNAITIGSESTCDIVLQGVAPLQARIKRTASHLPLPPRAALIESEGGIVVNGQFVAPKHSLHFRSGATITFNPSIEYTARTHTFTFAFAEGDPANDATPAVPAPGPTRSIPRQSRLLLAQLSALLSNDPVFPFLDHADHEFAAQQLIWSDCNDPSSPKPAPIKSYSLPKSQTVLHLLCLLSNATQIVKRFPAEELKLAVETPDATGRTPLHWATSAAKSEPYARYLLEIGANPNALDLHAHSPLHYAILRSADPDFIAFLIQKGADPNLKAANVADAACLAITACTLPTVTSILHSPAYNASASFSNIFNLICRHLFSATVTERYKLSAKDFPGIRKAEQVSATGTAGLVTPPFEKHATELQTIIRIEGISDYSGFSAEELRWIDYQRSNLVHKITVPAPAPLQLQEVVDMVLKTAPKPGGPNPITAVDGLQLLLVAFQANLAPYSIETLLNLGFDLAATDADQNNCFHHCARFAQDPVVFKLVFKKLADLRLLSGLINAKNNQHETPLFLFLRTKFLKHQGKDLSALLETFIDMGADTNVQCTSRKLTPLMSAILNKDLAGMMTLAKLSDATSVGLVDADGNTALHLLFSLLPSSLNVGLWSSEVMESIVDVAKLLIGRGGRLDALNAEGFTPVLMLLRTGSLDWRGPRKTATGKPEDEGKEKVRALVKELFAFVNTCNALDVKDSDGYTLLHRCIQFGFVDFALLLYQQGANILTTNNKGENILTTALGFVPQQTPATNFACVRSKDAIDPFQPRQYPLLDAMRSGLVRWNPVDDVNEVLATLVSDNAITLIRPFPTLHSEMPQTPSLSNLPLKAMPKVKKEDEEPTLSKSTLGLTRPVRNNAAEMPLIYNDYVQQDASAVRVVVNNQARPKSSFNIIDTPVELQTLLLTLSQSIHPKEMRALVCDEAVSTAVDLKYDSIATLLAGNVRNAMDAGLPVLSFQNLFDPDQIARQVLIRAQKASIQKKLFGPAPDKSTQAQSDLLSMPPELQKLIIAWVADFPAPFGVPNHKDVYSIYAACRSLKLMVLDAVPSWAGVRMSAHQAVVSILEPRYPHAGYNPILISGHPRLDCFRFGFSRQGGICFDNKSRTFHFLDWLDGHRLIGANEDDQFVVQPTDRLGSDFNRLALADPKSHKIDTWEVPFPHILLDTKYIYCYEKPDKLHVYDLKTKAEVWTWESNLLRHLDVNGFGSHKLVYTAYNGVFVGLETTSKLVIADVATKTATEKDIKMGTLRLDRSFTGGEKSHCYFVRDVSFIGLFDFATREFTAVQVGEMDDDGLLVAGYGDNLILLSNRLAHISGGQLTESPLTDLFWDLASQTLVNHGEHTISVTTHMATLLIKIRPTVSLLRGDEPAKKPNRWGRPSSNPAALRPFPPPPGDNPFVHAAVAAAAPDDGQARATNRPAPKTRPKGQVTPKASKQPAPKTTKKVDSDSAATKKSTGAADATDEPDAPKTTKDDAARGFGADPVDWTTKSSTGAAEKETNEEPSPFAPQPSKKAVSGGFGAPTPSTPFGSTSAQSEKEDKEELQAFPFGNPTPSVGLSAASGPPTFGSFPFGTSSTGGFGVAQVPVKKPAGGFGSDIPLTPASSSGAAATPEFTVAAPGHGPARDAFSPAAQSGSAPPQSPMAPMAPASPHVGGFGAAAPSLLSAASSATAPSFGTPAPQGSSGQGGFGSAAPSFGWTPPVPAFGQPAPSSSAAGSFGAPSAGSSFGPPSPTSGFGIGPTRTFGQPAPAAGAATAPTDAHGAQLHEFGPTTEAADGLPAAVPTAFRFGGGPGAPNHGGFQFGQRGGFGGGGGGFSGGNSLDLTKLTRDSTVTEDKQTANQTGSFAKSYSPQPIHPGLDLPLPLADYRSMHVGTDYLLVICASQVFLIDFAAYKAFIKESD